jgi:hypothetical protein
VRAAGCTIKNPRIAAGISWKLSLPTHLNPPNHWRDDCADNEQSGQPVFMSDNNANGRSKNKILIHLRRQYPN